MNTGNDFKNQEFIALTRSIRKQLPWLYLVGILMSYVINGVLIGVFLYMVLKEIIGHDASIFISIAGPFAVQLFRFLIIFTDQLFPESGNTAKFWVQIVAAVMTAWGIFEIYHLLKGHDLSWSEFLGVFGFGVSIVAAGWLMEINFIKKVNEFTSSETSLGFMGKINGQAVYTSPEMMQQMQTLLKKMEDVNGTRSSDSNSGKKSESKQKSLKEKEAPKNEQNTPKKEVPKEEEPMTADF